MYSQKEHGFPLYITNDVKNTADCSLFVYRCLIHLENLYVTSIKRPNVVTVLQNPLNLLNKQHWTIAN
jgi:hypothetical protein